MPARSIGTATISFGLVSVPVEVYSTGESSVGVSFNMVHKDCGTKLKQKYVCPKHEVEVDREHTSKGYEFAKGQYVIFSPDEIKALDQKATNSIDIDQFVPLSAVDRLYLEKAYYLGPGKGGEKAYKLLAKALDQTGRAGLGQYAARGKQNMVYADELRSPKEVPLGEGEVKPAELALAKQFIEQAATDEFKPEAYHDTVRERILEAIQQKVDGQEITAEPEPEKGTKILDLMEALKASLAKKGAGEKVEKKDATKAAKAERPLKRKAAGGR